MADVRMFSFSCPISSMREQAFLSVGAMNTTISCKDELDAGGTGIQVICAGLGRTGTMSLTEALKDLGYTPYHYVEVKHSEQWADFASGGKTSVEEIIDLLQDGYTATLDNPSCDIYHHIMKRFPTAKVILTVRDDPAKFVQSWKMLFDTMVVTETTFSWRFPSFLGYIPLFRNLKAIRYFMGTTHLKLPPGEFTHGWRNRPDADQWLAEQYEKHNQHVIDHVPKDRLLVFNVKEGWKPLCDFLGKDVPRTVPFPHSTTTTAESMRKMKRLFLVIVYGWIPFAATLLGVAIFALSRATTSMAWFSSAADQSSTEL